MRPRHKPQPDEPPSTAETVKIFAGIFGPITVVSACLFALQFIPALGG